MAKGMFFGIDSKARKSKRGYIGINGVARKIKKVYFGVDGKARLAWSGLENMNYVIMGHAYNSSNSNKTDAFLAYERTDNTSLSLLSTGSRTYNNDSSRTISVARESGNIVAICLSRDIQVFKKSSTGYTNIFTLTGTNIHSYIPNTTSTSFIHTTPANLRYIESDFMGLSSNGVYLYCGVRTLDSSVSPLRTTLAVIIFNISSGTPVYSSHFILYNTTISQFSINSVQGKANDDLSVFVTRVAYSEYGNSYYSISCYIKNSNNSFTQVSFPSYRSDYNHVYSGFPHLDVSPDGNYVSYKSEMDNPNNYVYNDQRQVIAKVNKSNYSLSVVAAGSVYTASVQYAGFLDNEHYYFAECTTNHYDGGTWKLHIMTLSNGVWTETTHFTMQHPTSGGNLTGRDSNGVIGLAAIGLDLINNIIFIGLNNYRFSICTLTGTNGTYTGYTHNTLVDYPYTCRIGQIFVG